MGWLRQFRILSWKNIKLRKRKPVLIFFEVLWPLVVLALVGILKKSISVEDLDHCYYIERALPRSGMVPFIQTFGCSLDEQCKNVSEVKKRTDAMGDFSRLVSDLEPALSKNSTVDTLKGMGKTVDIVNALKNAAKDLPSDLDDMMQIRKLLKDPDKVKEILVSDFKLFTEDVAEAIMNASLNPVKLFEITGYIDFQDIVCDKDKLAEVLLFSYDVNVTLVSEYLCNINSSYIPQITDLIMKEISVSHILKIVQRFSDFRKEYDISAGISDLRTMLELIYGMPEISDFIKTLPPLEDLKNLLERLPDFIERARAFSYLNLDMVSDIFKSLDPFIAVLQVDPRLWESIKNALSVSIKIQDLLNTKFISKMTKARLGDLLSWNEASFVMTVENAYKLEKTDIVNLYNTVVDISKIQSALYYDSPVICSATLNDAISDEQANRILLNLQTAIGCTDASKPQGSEFENKIKDNSQWIANIKKYHQSLIMDTINEFVDLTNTTMVKDSILKFLPMLSDINFSETWKTMKALFTGEEVSLERKTEVLSNLQKMLETTGKWNSTEPWLAMIDNYVYFAEMMYNMTTGMYWQWANTFTNDLMNSTMHGLINLGPEVTKNILMAFTKVDVVEALVYSKADYQVTCRRVLVDYVKPTEAELNKTLHDLLCNDDISSLLNDLMKNLNYREMQDKYTEMFTTFTNSLQQPSIKKIQLSELYIRFETVYVKYSKFYMSLRDHMRETFEMLKKFESDERPEKWQSVMKVMYEAVTKNIMHEVVRSAAVTMERMDVALANVSMWRTVKHVATAANAMIRFTNKYMFVERKGMTLEEFMTINSTKIYEFYRRAGEITPDIIDAAKNTIIMPEKELCTIASLKRTETTTGSCENPQQIQARFHLVTLLVNPGGSLAVPLFRHVLYKSVYKNFKSPVFPMMQLGIQFFQSCLTELPEGALSDRIEWIEFLVASWGKLMLKLMVDTNFFTDKICNPTMVSSFLVLPENSPVFDYDKYLCSLNWTEIAEQSFFDADMKLFKKELELLYGPQRVNLPDVYVNWTEVSRNVMLYVENSLELIKTGALNFTSRGNNYGFDMTKINMKLEDLVSAMQNIDGGKYTNYLQYLGPMLDKLPKDPSMISNVMAVYNNYNYKFMVAVNTELTKIIETKKFDVVDYFNSSELNKILARSQYSPEIVQVVFDTMLELLKNPSKGAQLYNLDKLEQICSDLTEFEKYIVIPTSSNLTSSYLQKVFCNRDVNVTKLLEELNANPISVAVSEYVMKLMYIYQDTTNGSVISVNYTTLIAENTKYQDLLNQVLQLSVKVTYGGFEENLQANFSVYEDMWNNFMNDVKQLYSGANMQSSINKLIQIIQQAFSSMDGGFAKSTAFYTFYSKFLKEVNIILTKVNETRTFDVIDYYNSEQLTRMLSRNRNNPAILETVFETLIDFMKNPSKAADLANMEVLQTICSNVTVFEFYVTMPASTNLTSSYMQSVFCNRDINITKLMEELNANPISAAINEYIQQIMTTGMQNTSDVNTTATIDLAGIMSEYDKTSALMAGIMSSPVTVTYGGLENNINPEMMVYEDIWNNFVNQLKDLYTGENLQSTIGKIVQVQSNILYTYFKDDPLVKRSAEFYDFYLKLLQEVNNLLTSVNETRTFDVVNYYNSEQLRKMLTRNQNNPVILETVFETLLHLIKNPMKVAELSDTDVLTEICSNVTVFEDYVIMPKSSSLTSSYMQSVFCNRDINITKLMEELNTNPISALISQYVMKVMQNTTDASSTYTVDMAAIMAEYQKSTALITHLMRSQVKITYGGFENNLNANMTVYDGIWNNFVSQLEAIYTGTDLQRIISELDPALKAILSKYGLTSVSRASAAYNTLYMTFLKEMNSVLTKINETRTIDMLEFYKFDELKKTLKVSENGPEVLEVIFQTMLKFMKDPTIVQELSSMEAMGQMCSDLEFFKRIVVIPQTSKLTPLELQDTFCNRNINITILMQEMNQDPLAQAVDTYIKQIMEGFNSSESNATVDYIAIMSEYNNLMALITEVSKAEIKIVFGNMSMNWEQNSQRYMEKWNSFVEELKTEYYRVNDTLESIITSVINSTIFSAMKTNWITDMPAVQEYIRNAVVVYSGIESALEKMVVQNNGTEYLMVENLFQETTAMKELYKVMQKPGVLETILNSINTDKFNKLFAMNNVTAAVYDLCMNMDYYLTVPSYTTLNVTLFRYEFCSINLTLLPTEMENLFMNSDTLMSLNGSSSAETLSKLMSLYQRINNRIMGWIQNPPMVIIANNPTWSNATYWLEFLMKYSSNRQSPGNMAKEIESMLDKLRPQFNLEPVRKIGLILETVSTVMNEYVRAFRTGNLTLSKKFFEPFNLSPNITESILAAPITNPGNILGLFFQNWQETLCKYSFWEQTFSFSKDVNITEIQMAFCNMNASYFQTPAMTEVSVEVLMKALENTGVEPDWTLLITNFQQLQQMITEMASDPTAFSLPNALKTFEKMSKSGNMWGLVHLYTAMGKASKDDTTMKAVDGFIRVGTVMAEYLQSAVDKLTPDGSKLDLGSLLQNATQFKMVLKTVAKMDSNLISKFIGLKLNPTKGQEFSNIISNATKLASFLCSEKQMKEIFKVNDDAVVKDIVNVTCGFNQELLVAELMEAVGYEDLMIKIMDAMNSTNKDYNIEGYLSAVQKMSQSLLKFMNVTSVTLDEFDFSSLASGFENIDYNALLKKLNDENAKNIAYTTDVLEKFLLPVLNGSSTGQEILTYVWTINKWAKLFNQHLQRAVDSDMTLASLFSAQSQMINVDAMLLALTNADTMKLVNVNFTKLMELISDEKAKDMLCGMDLWSALVVPAEANNTVSELQNRICSMNNTVRIWKTLMLTKDFMDIFTKLTTMKTELQNVDLANINLSETTQLLMQTSDLIQNILKNASFPDLSQQMANATVVRMMMVKVTQFLQTHSASLYEKGITAIVKMVAPDSADSYLTGIAKYINSMNLFMEIAHTKLAKIKDEITLEGLAGNNTEILNMLKSLANLQRNGVDAFSNGNITWDALLKLLQTPEDFANVCKDGSLAQRISPENTPPSSVAKDIANIVCVTPQRVYQIMQDHIELSKIQTKLGEIWSDNYTGKADWQAYTKWSSEYLPLIEKFIANPPVLGPDLKTLFNFENMLDLLKKSMNDPKMLLPIFGLIGPATSQMDNTMINKYVNTMNLILREVNKKLEEAKDNLTPETLSKNGTEILNFLKSFLDLQYSFSNAIMSGDISWSDVSPFVENSSTLLNACGTSSFASIMNADNKFPASFVQGIEKIFCAYPGTFTYAVKDITESGKIQKEIMQIWSANYSVAADWMEMFMQGNKLNMLIMDMMKSSPFNLSDSQNFEKTTEFLQSFLKNPKMMIGILGTMLPSIPGTGSSDMAKIVNTINAVIEATNTNIENMNDQTLWDVVTRNSTVLMNVLKAAMNIQYSLNTAIRNGFSFDPLTKLLQSPDEIIVNCRNGTLAEKIDPFKNPVDKFATDVERIVCAFPDEIVESMKNQAKVQQEIATYWSANYSGIPDWISLVENSKKLDTLIMNMFKQPFMNPKTNMSSMNIENMFKSLMTYMNDPKYLSRQMEYYSYMLDDMMKVPDINMAMQYVDRLVLAPFVKLMEDTKAIAPELSWESLTSNKEYASKFLTSILSSSGQMDLIADSYIKPMINFLGSKSEIRTAVCNAQTVSSLNLPSSMSEVSQWLCTPSGDVWYNILQNHTVTNTDITLLINKLSPFQVSPSMPTISGSDVMKNVGKIYEMIQELGSIENLSMDLILNTTLEVWQAQTKQNSLASIRLLEAWGLLDSSKKDFMKNVVNSMYAINDYMKTLLDKLEGTKDGLPFTLLFSNSTRLSELLETLIDSPTAAEIMASTLRPDMVTSWTNTSFWVSVACDPVAFNQTFTFVKEIKVDKVQKSLCKSFTNRADALTELVNMMNVGDIIKSMEDIIAARMSDKTKAMENVWEKYYDQGMLMVEYLMKLSKYGFDDEKNQQWLDPVLKMLQTYQATSTERSIVLCDNMMNYMEHVLGMSEFLTGVSYFELGLVSMKGQLKMILDFQDVLCEDSKLNFTNLAKVLDTEQGAKEIQKVFSNPGSLNGRQICREIDGYRADIQRMMTVLFATTDESRDRMEKCMETLPDSIENLLKDVDSYLLFAKEAISIVDKSLLTYMVYDDEFSKMMQFFIKIIMDQKGEVIRLVDILKSGEDFKSVMNQAASVSSDVIQRMLNSSLKLNVKKLVDITEEDLEKLLCSPDELRNTMTIPGFSVNDYYSLADKLCNANVSTLARGLKSAIEISKLMLAINKMETKSDMTSLLRTLAEDMSNIAKNINGLNELFEMYNLIYVKPVKLNEIVPLLQRVLIRREPDKILDSVMVFIEHLEAANNDPSVDRILTVVKKIVRGLGGLKLITYNIPMTVVIEDVIKDSTDLRKFLQDDLAIPPKVVDAILQSSISFLKVMNSSTAALTDSICNGANLGNLLLFNNSKINPSEISSKLCSLNDSTLADLTERIMEQLDVGKLVQKYVETSGNAIFDSSKITVEEVKEVLKNLKNGKEDFTDLSVKLKNSTLVEEMKNIMKKPEALTGVGYFDSMASMICGSDVSVGDQFNLHNLIKRSTRQEGPSQQRRKRKKRELFEENFCVKLMLNILDMSNGQVIWTYINPLLHGRIPYAPQNTVTDKIMREVNKAFSVVGEARELAETWASGAKGLEGLKTETKDTDELQSILGSKIVSGILQQMVGVSGEDLVYDIESIQSFDTQEISTMQKLAELVANYTSCVSTSRVEGYATEQKMLERIQDLSKSNLVIGGVVFTNKEFSEVSENGNAPLEIPKHIQYKLRFDSDNVPYSSNLEERMWTPQPEDSVASDLRYLRGFIPLQDIIDRAIIDVQLGKSVSHPNLELKQMPYPCHKHDLFLKFLGEYFLPLVLTASWLSVLGVATRILMYDRENGQQEMMTVMGMKDGLGTMIWFMFSMLVFAFLSIIYAVVLYFCTVTSYSNIGVIFVDILLFSFSSLLMCYMISSFFTRQALALLSALIVYLISYLPFLVIAVMQYQMTEWQKLVACLSSTTAFGFSAQYISRYELQQVGLHWNNLDSSPLKNDNTYFCYMWIMMAADGIIYFLIGWYVRNVKPGKFGIGQPWYFPFSPYYWNCPCGSNSQKYAPGRSQASGSLSEEIPDDCLIGISLQGLRKSYNKKDVVVSNLNIDFCEGDVTAMIGPNGAAKSTIINMMVGILRPTAGQVFMYGNTLRDSNRRLGICAQFNALTDYMTVLEHMEFYASFKCKPSWGQSRIAKDIKQVLMAVNLWKYRDVQVSKLSGGMQRRMCVALAFVGGSDVIVLDEPTSGIDANARRAIWNLIIKNKSCRTIIVSTHHLDEADVIADRVALVHEGNVLCSGSPMFLKQQIGSGYKLTIEKRSSNQAMQNQDTGASESLTRDVKSYIPRAYVAEEMATEIVMFLPVLEEEETRLPTLCDFLDTNKHRLNIATYAMSFTSLEEVFIKMSSLADAKEPLTPENLHHHNLDTKTQEFKEYRKHSALEAEISGHGSLKDNKMRDRDAGCTHKFTQLGALLTKRFFHVIRNWRISVSVIILPLLFFLLATWFSILKPYSREQPSLLLSPSMYGPKQYSFYKDQSGHPLGSKILDTFTHDPGMSTTCMKGEFSKGYLELTDYQCVSPSTQFTRPDTYYNNKSKCNCEDFRFTCDKGSGGIPPKDMETTTTQILMNLEDRNVNDYLTDTHLQFIDKRYGGFTLDKNDDSNLTATIWFNNKGHHAMPAYLNAYSNAFLRANIDPAQGSPEDYGITVYNHPLEFGNGRISLSGLLQSAADVGISIIVLIAFTFVPAGLLIYTVGEKIKKEKQIQMISGVGPILYWLSTYIWDLIIFCIPVGCAVVIIVAFDLDMYMAGRNLEGFVSLLLLYGWSILPFMYLFLRPIKDASAVYMVVFCINVFIGILTTICIYTLDVFQNKNDYIKWSHEVLQYVFLIFPQFCLGRGLMKMATNFMAVDLLKRFGKNVYADPFTLEMIGIELIVMAAEGLLLFILTIIIESMKSSPLKLPNGRKETGYEDEDVENEKHRVLGENHQGSALFVQDLSKVYRRNLHKFYAVDHISFGVYKGECFGLLGVNGAGKTTTFRVLTGDILPSSGHVILNGKRMAIHSSKIGQDIGYCPQEDALDNYLTGRRLLYFYAKLRGIPSESIDKAVEDIIQKLQLGKHADKIVQQYSGGMKRKLSVCIALLGNPSVIYLDEPTTGMDPSTKRLVWNCITDAIRAGQSVVLTSHSMEECDVLCDRLAIMVNGEFKCFGTPQHLKERFGGGYTVRLHVHGLTVEKHLVRERLLSHFRGSEIVFGQYEPEDQHEHVLQMNIPKDAATVSTIFSALQREKQDRHITQYSVSQTTLEDVFLNFSQDQTDKLSDGGSGSSRSPSYSSSNTSENKKSTPGSSNSDAAIVGYVNPVYQGDDLHNGMTPYQQNITFGGLYTEKEVPKDGKVINDDIFESTRL